VSRAVYSKIVGLHNVKWNWKDVEWSRHDPINSRLQTWIKVVGIFFRQSLVLYLDVWALTTQNEAQIIFYGQFHHDMTAGLSNEEDITGPTLYVQTSLWDIVLLRWILKPFFWHLMKKHFGHFQQASGTVHTTQHSMQILQCSEKGLEDVGYDHYVVCVFCMCVTIYLQEKRFT